MNLDEMRERTRRLRSIPLESVLLAVGAQQDLYDQKKWHTTQGVISITGMKFMNWNRAIGGGGAIDLIIHLNGLDFKNAIAWLGGQFPNCDFAHRTGTVPSSTLKLPQPDVEKLNAVKQYLSTQRRIHPALINRLIQSGDLYADHCANAVFLMRGKHHAAIGAELRGTGHHPWRGMAPGSHKNLGAFSIREGRVSGFILCESAIDAISCFMIHPACCCISTAGARPNPLWLPALIHKGIPIHCGFDADTTGDDMAQAMINRYPTLLRLRPQRHDWNEMLTAKS
jgi:hypothetical protein